MYEHCRCRHERLRRFKPVDIEAFITDCSVDRFDECVVGRLSEFILHEWLRSESPARDSRPNLQAVMDCEPVKAPQNHKAQQESADAL